MTPSIQSAHTRVNSVRLSALPSIAAAQTVSLASLTSLLGLLLLLVVLMEPGGMR